MKEGAIGMKAKVQMLGVQMCGNSMKTFVDQ
jgi:hypothetical protein